MKAFAALLAGIFGMAVLPVGAELPPITYCISCHEVSGNTGAYTVPNIGGLQSSYIFSELQAFRDKKRTEDEADFMWDAVKDLPDPILQALATYFSNLPPATSVFNDPAQVALGKSLFEAGIPEKGVPACTSCHGANGEGLVGPRVANQKAFYLGYQYQAFKLGKRREALFMPTFINNITKQQWDAMAAYLESK